MLNSIGVLSGQPAIVNVTVAVPCAGTSAAAGARWRAVAPVIVPRVIGPLRTPEPLISTAYDTLPSAHAVVLRLSGSAQWTTGTPLTVVNALSTLLPGGTVWIRPSTMSCVVVASATTVTGPAVPWGWVVSPAAGCGARSYAAPT